MIKKIAENIRDELYKKIDTMYNRRKLEEGLVSVHNTQLNHVKVLLQRWVDEEEAFEKRIDKMHVGK